MRRWRRPSARTRLKDEIRRLKGLPPRPPIKPSGMEKATDGRAAESSSQADASPPRRRGPGVSKLSIDRSVTLTASAPAGSRPKGCEEIIVQDIAFKPEVTLYRRERWATPDGRTVTADLPAGVVGGCGPHLIRLVLMLHFQGQMTCERIVTLLTAAGLSPPIKSGLDRGDGGGGASRPARSQATSVAQIQSPFLSD